MKCSHPGRLAILAAGTAALLALPAAVLAGPTPTPTPAPAFTPYRVRTDRLSAKGTGGAAPSAPFSFRTRTETLKAKGLGQAAEPTFKPLRIRTDALSAKGKGAGGTK